VLNVDRSYSASARTAAERRIASMRAELGRVSDVRFVLTLAQIVALADSDFFLDTITAPSSL
jgi:hypothetical protein